MKKIMKKLFYTSIILGCLSLSLNAQVGINNTNPNKYSALDINGGGTKGIIIPNMTQITRESLKNENLPRGLLVFDSNTFFFWNGTEWIALNPLQATDNNKNTLKLPTNGATITFSNNLNITGTTTIQNVATINNKLTVNGNIDAVNNTINAKTLTATTGNINNITATTGNINTVTATTGNINTVTATTGNITTVNATTVNATKGQAQLMPVRNRSPHKICQIFKDVVLKTARMSRQQRRWQSHRLRPQGGQYRYHHRKGVASEAGQVMDSSYPRYVGGHVACRLLSFIAFCACIA